MKKSSCPILIGASRSVSAALCVIACAAFFASCTNFLDFAEKANASKYSLSYVANGADSGSAPQQVSDVSGAKIVVSENTGSLAKSGYVFTGWNTASDGNGTSYAPGATFTMPDKGSALFAMWSIASFTVTFDSDSATTAASPASITVTKPATTVETLPAAPSRTGFNFGGWWTEKNGKGTQFTASTEVAANITVYAKWSNKSLYVVAFDTDGGSTVASQSVEEGSVAEAPGSPTKSGYTFGGWFTDNTYVTAWNFADMKIMKATTIFAKWLEPTLYTVSVSGDITITGYTGTDTIIVLPKSIAGHPVVAIADNAFKGKTSITSITIPDSVTSIGQSTFESCTGLTSITIPDSVTSIGSNAFLRCKGLTSITIPDSVTSISSGAFNGCTGLTSLTIPDSVTSIGCNAFCGCTGLTSITLSNSVKTIEDYCFASCTHLTSITIPNSVTSIGDSAFGTCTGLTSITFPSSVRSIGQYAFFNCTSLTTIIVNSTTPPATNDSFTKNASLKIHVPKGCLEIFTKSASWTSYADCIIEQA